MKWLKILIFNYSSIKYLNKKKESLISQQTRLFFPPPLLLM